MNRAITLDPHTIPADQDVEQGTALSEALFTTGNEPAMLALVQRAWLQAMTRDEALRLMQVIGPLMSHSPALAIQLVDGITWVDRFLRSEGSL